MRAHGLTMKSLLGVCPFYQAASICRALTTYEKWASNGFSTLKCPKTRPCCEGRKDAAEQHTEARGCFHPARTFFWFLYYCSFLVQATKWFLACPLLPTPTIPKFCSSLRPLPTPPENFFERGRGALQKEKMLRPSNHLGLWLFAVGNSGGGGGELVLEPK